MRAARPFVRGRTIAHAALWLSAVLVGPGVARGQGSAPARSGSRALLVEAAVGFVPYANDVPTMLGLGLRLASVHEVWARAGYMPTGDDRGYGFGVAGYRAVFRPARRVRPTVGGLFAALPATCGHDAAGRPSCAPDPLFILAATGGVRLEPVPWLGVTATLSLGVDSYPNPFGMVEVAVTVALPLS